MHSAYRPTSPLSPSERLHQLVENLKAFAAADPGSRSVWREDGLVIFGHGMEISIRGTSAAVPKPSPTPVFTAVAPHGTQVSSVALKATRHGPGAKLTRIEVGDQVTRFVAMSDAAHWLAMRYPAEAPTCVAYVNKKAGGQELNARKAIERDLYRLPKNVKVTMG